MFARPSNTRPMTAHISAISKDEAVHPAKCQEIVPDSVDLLADLCGTKGTFHPFSAADSVAQLRHAPRFVLLHPQFQKSFFWQAGRLLRDSRAPLIVASHRLRRTESASRLLLAVSTSCFEHQEKVLHKVPTTGTISEGISCNNAAAPATTSWTYVNTPTSSLLWCGPPAATGTPLEGGGAIAWPCGMLFGGPPTPGAGKRR